MHLSSGRDRKRCNSKKPEGKTGNGSNSGGIEDLKDLEIPEERRKNGRIKDGMEGNGGRKWKEEGRNGTEEWNGMEMEGRNGMGKINKYLIIGILGSKSPKK